MNTIKIYAIKRHLWQPFAWAELSFVSFSFAPSCVHLAGQIFLLSHCPMFTQPWHCFLLGVLLAHRISLLSHSFFLLSHTTPFVCMSCLWLLSCWLFTHCSFVCHVLHCSRLACSFLLLSRWLFTHMFTQHPHDVLLVFSVRLSCLLAFRLFVCTLPSL
jgi:hypothetical protein